MQRAALATHRSSQPDVTHRRSQSDASDGFRRFRFHSRSHGSQGRHVQSQGQGQPEEGHLAATENHRAQNQKARHENPQHGHPGCFVASGRGLQELRVLVLSSW